MKYLWIILALLTAGAAASRLIALDSSPPGFFIDEAGGAVNAICIAESGKSELGQTRPIFFPAFDRASGAYFSAPYIYPLAGWVKIVGKSVYAIRSFTAFCSILSIIGLFCLGNFLAGRRAGLLVALVAAVSPWHYQFSRIAWDPPISVMFFVWGSYFFISMNSYTRAIAGGAFTAFAAYSYPPVRLQIVLLAPALIWICHLRRSLNFKYVLTFVCVMTLFAVPLVLATLNGEIQGRFNMLSVFSSDYLNGQFGSDSWVYGIRAFFANMLAHFDLRYLFVSGDANLRHSTGAFGTLGWLELLSIIGLLVTVFSARGKKANGITKIEAWYLGFGLWGLITGVAVASLTWESIPHALRSFGGAPFAILFCGLALHFTVRAFPRAIWTVTAMAVLFSGVFFQFYFAKYPKLVPHWFDAQIIEMGTIASKTGNWENFLANNRNYISTGLRYQMISKGGFTCESSMELLPPNRN